MGWISTIARYYSDGLVDRLRECHEMNTYPETDKYAGRRVIAESMRGTTYYAVVESTRHGETIIWPVVTLTQVKGTKFYYKDISSYDFPPTLLKLLPTNFDMADFKEHCLAYELEHKSVKDKRKQLSKLGYGAIIQIVVNGKMIRLKKQPRAYQFKTDWWQILDRNETTYYPKSKIPSDYIIESL